MTVDRPTKICPSCGRSFEWRRKWKNTWESVRYCSAACRRPRESPRQLEAALLVHLTALKPGVTMCPSELARELGGSEAVWRGRMEPIRAAARQLEARGLVEWTQKGRRIDPEAARGPIRFRLSRR